MRARRTIKVTVQVLVSLLLVGLLVWRIDLNDTVHLANGEKVTGKVEVPRKSEPLGRYVVIRDGDRTDTIDKSILRTRAAVEYGFLSSLSDIQVPWLAAGIALFALLAPITAYRWQLLLRVQEVRLGFWSCLKLTVVGFFFDNAMPGSTGGDVLKAYYVARETHRKAEAVMSVVVDRAVGLLDLAMISAVALFFIKPGEGLQEAARVVAIFLAVVLLSSLVFYSRRIRRWVRLDALIRRLPFQRVVQRCDQAVFAYRYHKRAVVWALGLSVLTQVTAVLSLYLVGRGLLVRGDGEGLLGLGHYFVYFPVAIMVASVPVAPGGIGLREWAFVFFFGLAGVPAGMACALAVIYRAARMAWSLPGALFLWGGGRRVSAAEMQRELAASDPGAERPRPSDAEPGPDAGRDAT